MVAGALISVSMANPSTVTSSNSRDRSNTTSAPVTPMIRQEVP
jgi:hypothetical protein